MCKRIMVEDDDWLDNFSPETPDTLVQEHAEELLCFRKRGRGSMDHRFVPRLPLTAMIRKMKILDDSSSSGRHTGGGGRARILQDRARNIRPHGLHQKKHEKLTQKVQREVTSESPCVESCQDGSDQTSKNQFKQDDFPSLGFEHTLEGSPKKKSKSMTYNEPPNVLHTEHIDVNMKEKDEEDKNHSANLPSYYIQENLLHDKISEKVDVKPKTLIHEKFDFAKANQNLLQEFPIAKHSGLKILSLTQHNLEKFLRESDTESSCSSQDIKSQNSTQENLQDLPVYQRYAVTLDDIQNFKATKAHPKETGQLANLLEAMDNYCADPESYFETFNQSKKEIKDEVANSNPFPSSSHNLESNISNLSVVTISDLSNLSSPSEKGFEKVDSGVQNVDSNMETCNETCINTLEAAECQNSYRNGENHISNQAICNLENTNPTKCNHNTVETNSSKNNENKVNDFAEDGTVENHYDKSYKPNSMGELYHIDLSNGPDIGDDSCDITEENMEGFQKVISKQTKKKTSSKKVFSVCHDQSVWRIYGKTTLQVDGLPEKCNLSELYGMVAGFGSIVDSQVRCIYSGTSVRFKLHSIDACEFAVQCLDDTDCLFPDSNCKLSCYQLQS